jgi:hypothetical protein
MIHAVSHSSLSLVPMGLLALLPYHRSKRTTSLGCGLVVSFDPMLIALALLFVCCFADAALHYHPHPRGAKLWTASLAKGPSQIL